MTTESQGAQQQSSNQPATQNEGGEQFSQQDVDAAFSAGFSNDEAPIANSNKATAAESPTKDASTNQAKQGDKASPASASSSAQPADKPAAPAEGPKFAGFSETEIKQLLSSVPENSRQYGELSKQMRQINGWIGAINQRLTKLGGSAASAAAPAAGASASKAVLDSDAMKKLEEDLPDVAAALKAALTGLSAGPGGPSKEEIDQIVAGKVGEQINAFRAEETHRQQRALYRAHPELREAAAKAPQGTLLADLLPGFRVWLAAQPKDYQDEVNSADDWSTVSEAITKFKGAAQDPEAQRKAKEEADRKAKEEADRKARQDNRLERAAAPSGVPAASHSGETAEQAFLKAFTGTG